MYYFWNVKKKKKFQIDILFNIKQIEMGCVTFALMQHNSFIKRVKWVGLGQPALLIGKVRVEKS